MKEDRPIIVSRLRWYVIPLFAMALFCLVIIAVDLATGADLLSSLWNARRGARFIGWLLAAPIAAVGILWYIRRVKVYPDRIEVKYPLHTNWNCVINTDEIDCFCLEQQIVEDKGDDFHYNNRIYLLAGRKLWLYISKDDCANYDEMLKVLKDVFRFELRAGNIYLSDAEQKIVKHGGYIELEDISEEELALMKAKRLTRQRPTAVASAKKDYGALKEWGVLLCVACVAAIIFFGLKLQDVMKQRDTMDIPLLSKNTQLAEKNYLMIDSIDVDTTAFFWRERKLSKREINKTVANCELTWIFPVRGSNRIWVALSVLVNDKDSVTEDTQKAVLADALHHRHEYHKLANGIEWESFMSVAKREAFGNTAPSEVFLLLCEDKPERIGVPLFMESLELYRDKQYDESLKKLILSASRDSLPDAMLRLADTYHYGWHTDADTAKATKWYETVIQQNRDETVTADALNDLSYIYADRDNYVQAIATVERAIEIGGDKIANYYDSKGEFLYKTGDIDGARIMWNKVLKADPGFLKKHNGSTELFRLLSENEKK